MPLLENLLEEAAVAAGVARRAGLHNLHEQRVVVAVRRDAHHLLHVAARRALVPERLAAAAVKHV